MSVLIPSNSPPSLWLFVGSFVVAIGSLIFGLAFSASALLFKRPIGRIWKIVAIIFLVSIIIGSIAFYVSPPFLGFTKTSNLEECISLCIKAEASRSPERNKTLIQDQCKTECGLNQPLGQ